MLWVELGAVVPGVLGSEEGQLLVKEEAVVVQPQQQLEQVPLRVQLQPLQVWMQQEQLMNVNTFSYTSSEQASWGRTYFIT